MFTSCVRSTDHTPLLSNPFGHAWNLSWSTDWERRNCKLELTLQVCSYYGILFICASGIVTFDSQIIAFCIHTAYHLVLLVPSAYENNGCFRATFFQLLKNCYDKWWKTWKTSSMLFIWKLWGYANPASPNRYSHRMNVQQKKFMRESLRLDCKSRTSSVYRLKSNQTKRKVNVYDFHRAKALVCFWSILQQHKVKKILHSFSKPPFNSTPGKPRQVAQSVWDVDGITWTTGERAELSMQQAGHCFPDMSKQLQCRW